ncbi:uncharacterized protein LOC106142318 [Amyelois transitella]|uniref:uncharacterized protein LOC106142318 n=1 Tax=Amyelois transitella TaxID=680683 RepID=UPI0029906339|nr:uncharacterized protein LOC106142318 [Amyelois transitella]
MADTPNKTAQYFINLAQFAYWLGMPDIWIQEVARPKRIVRIHDAYCYTCVILISLLVVFEYGALFTEQELSDRQHANMVLFVLCHPLVIIFIMNSLYFEKRTKRLLYDLAVGLKSVYNDEDIEAVTVQKMKVLSRAFVWIFATAIFFYGVDALVNVVWYGATFTTVILAWPQTHHRSPAADLARVFFYLIFLNFMLLLGITYMVNISITICLSSQFKNMQSYFYKLADLFKEDNMTQEQKESKYEENFKLGIRLHAKTSWCKQEWQAICNVIFSFQVVLNIGILILMLAQLVLSEERSLASLIASLFTIGTILSSTGLLMLNAGDVTVEAREISTAIYHSGWENCAGSSPRVRKLLVCAMMKGQKPEILWALRLIPMSYESFVSIVKSTYSIFSLLY